MPILDNDKKKKNNIEQTEKVAKKENENYLKNAKVAVEGNYDMIDGIINNMPPQKDEQVKSTHILSRKEIVDVANKQKSEQQKNREKSQERTPERI